MAVLEKYSALIPTTAYQHIVSDTYFREQSKLMNYFHNSQKQGPNPPKFDELFLNLEFEGHYTRSFEFRWFIDSYMSEKGKILNGFTENRSVDNRQLYTLSKMLLKDEIRYYAMAHFVYEGMRAGLPQEYKPIYADFQAEYPKSELANDLNAIFVNRADIVPGTKLPQFELKTLDGKRFSLEASEGKWRMLVFCDLDFYDIVEDMKTVTRLQKGIPAEWFEMIVAFTNENPKHTDEFLNDYQLNATLLDNHGWKESSTLPYNIDYRAPIYLINPEGELEFLGGADPWDGFLDMFIEYINYDISQRPAKKASLDPVFWWILLGVASTFTLSWAWFRMKTARLKKQEQEKLEKVELEIKAVRSQLNPHFIFNAMSSIQHLVNARDHENANLFLSKFATLMRKVLNQSDAQLLSLAQELETLTDYLDLESLRHGFEFDLNIEENVDIHNIDIPPMLLQPFVENAVVHGISQIKGEGKIIIDISKSSEEAISIKIIDNGMGLNQTAKPAQSNGKGLDLTKRRLSLIMEKFKNEISFALGDRKDFDGQRGAFAEIIVGLEN